ncbi:VOC family protein [Sandaracinobacteroides hominis]|uniref:VOC family protein n=1 Tax=Sandaracinobacteroides hominis TaxID=2780086 RepID=UPI0018F6382A|nr:VOC family protein [Sandaracinobacteroides hominis]
MIGYAMLGTNNLPAASAFYDALFDSIGIKRLMEFPKGPAYGVSWDKPMLGITIPYDDQPATAGNGTMIALAAGSRKHVDTMHARALELGGSCEGKPGIRGEEAQGFYGAYFRDLDGNKLCAFHVGA